MKMVIGFTGIAVCLISLSASAMGRNNDYSTSFYGAEAQKIFNASKKLTDTCTYVQANASAQGNLGDILNKLIGDKNINSVSCVHIGEQTYACEASTLWFGNPCKN